MIGNDARTGNPDETRADAMHIIGINPKTLKAGILNFPRDSYVSVPGHGSMKMNESLYVGGPDLLVRTIEQETGIQIDYWVMTGFEGFRHIVHNLGGVRVDVPYAIDDYGSGANLKKGEQVLNPEQALAFNRSRKTLPAGDIDRTGNQGLFLLSLLKQLHAETEGDPGAVIKWIGTTRKWARFDIPPDEMFRLGVLASQISPSDVKSVTVPASIGAVGLASVVFISPGANSIYRRFEKNGSL
ncbi:MAG: LCP family protein [Actinomycetota bacterium]|nr:LCP family protein [Actinomycetota bacterium]